MVNLLYICAFIVSIFGMVRLLELLAHISRYVMYMRKNPAARGLRGWVWRTTR